MLRTTAVAAVLASVLACTTALTGASPAPATATRDQTITLTVDGRVRTARVHLPNPMPDAKKAPLVLVFHGQLADADAQQALSQFNHLANAKGFIAVYPSGYQLSWNDGRKDTPSNRDGVRDVRFVRTLLDHLEQRYPVDRRQVFALGMSSGGFFTQRLGCVMPGRFAAVASVAAVLPRTTAKTCKPVLPLSVLIMMGTADPLVPYRGGPFGRAKVLSAKTSTKLWRDAAGCKRPRTRALPDYAPQDGTRTRVLTADRCEGGAAVKLFTIHGGGHTWPGGRQYLSEETIGRTSRDFDAGRAIWAFFSKHHRGGHSVR